MATAILSEVDERAIVSELSRLVLEEQAPEELLYFDELTKQYFRDPDAPPERRREERLGFGLELAMLTPALLAAVRAVVQFVALVVTDAAASESKAQLTLLMRRILGVHKAEAGEGWHGLTVVEARRVRDVAVEQLTAAGLDDRERDLLADAIVGRLFVRAG